MMSWQDSERRAVLMKLDRVADGIDRLADAVERLTKKLESVMGSTDGNRGLIRTRDVGRFDTR